MTDAADSRDDRLRRVPWWAGLVVGVAGAAVGLLPWLVTGARLPIQNLWATPVAPDSMPVALLPFSQDTIVLVFGLVATGSAVAGLAIRALRTRVGAAWWAFLGLLAAQVAAVVQTTDVVARGLRTDFYGRLYLVAVVAVAVIAVLLGMVVFWLIARAPRGGAVVGFAGAAVAATFWVEQFVVPFGSVPDDAVLTVLPAAEFVTPVLIGVAIAWAGVNSVGRVVGALLALAIAWIAPAVSTALFNSAGSRVLAYDIPQMIRVGIDVFSAALLTPQLALRPIITVVVVAALGLVVRVLVARRRRASRTPTAPADSEVG